MTASEIEAYIRENITAICEDSFPDNVGIQWNIIGFSEQHNLVFAEIEPQPDEVGYPRFKMGFLEVGGTPNCVAAYSLEDGEFTLLFTGDGAPAGLPQELD